MNVSQYIQSIQQCKVDLDKVRTIEVEYQCSLPSLLQCIISNNEEVQFLEDEKRVLCYEEILHATKDLSVDFLNLQLIPVMDCYDNDFVVYNIKTSEWCLFNIVDECIFRTNKELLDLL